MIVIAMRPRVSSSIRLKKGSAQDDASHGNLWSMLKRNHYHSYLAVTFGARTAVWGFLS